MKHLGSVCLLASLVSLICVQGSLTAAETTPDKTEEDSSVAWQEKAVEYARIMSHVKWTPVAAGMPKRGGYVEEGAEYTGVP